MRRLRLFVFSIFRILLVSFQFVSMETIETELWVIVVLFMSSPAHLNVANVSFFVRTDKQLCYHHFALPLFYGCIFYYFSHYYQLFNSAITDMKDSCRVTLLQKMNSWYGFGDHKSTLIALEPRHVALPEHITRCLRLRCAPDCSSISKVGII